MNPIKLLGRSGKIISYLLLCAFIVFSTLPVKAISSSDLQSINKDTVWYAPGVSGSGLCGPSDGSVGTTLPSIVPEPYNTLFSQAAAAEHMNPQFLAAIFLSENGNVWKPFDTKWATSPVGASGPFQFMPSTWDSYKTDGNKDGVADINNIYDAAYSAGKLLGGYAGLNAPLGSLNTPFKPNTLLEGAAAYNWGPGAVQVHTTPSSPITGDGSVPIETQNYIKNVYVLITSGFTKSGNPNYGDPSSKLSGGGSPTLSTGSLGCSGGIVAGSVVQTAINLSWPGPHVPPLEPKPEYLAALREHNPSVIGNAADCGVFVATVMHASGADSNYPASGTSGQETYVRSHPDKYQVIQLSATDTTAIFQPGDILIVNLGSGAGGNGHTMIFVGSQPGGNNEASASLDSRMPSLGSLTSVADSLGRGYYVLARLK